MVIVEIEHLYFNIVKPNQCNSNYLEYFVIAYFNTNCKTGQNFVCGYKY